LKKKRTPEQIQSSGILLGASINWNREFQFNAKGMYFITLSTGQEFYRQKVIYRAVSS
jgi:hypothetical protein